MSVTSVLPPPPLVLMTMIVLRPLRGRAMRSMRSRSSSSLTLGPRPKALRRPGVGLELLALALGAGRDEVLGARAVGGARGAARGSGRMPGARASCPSGSTATADSLRAAVWSRRTSADAAASSGWTAGQPEYARRGRGVPVQLVEPAGVQPVRRLRLGAAVAASWDVAESAEPCRAGCQSLAGVSVSPDSPTATRCPPTSSSTGRPGAARAGPPQPSPSGWGE